MCTLDHRGSMQCVINPGNPRASATRPRWCTDESYARPWPRLRGVYWEGKPWEERQEFVGQVEYEEYLWGTLYAAYGTVPRKESDEQEKE